MGNVALRRAHPIALVGGSALADANPRTSDYLGPADRSQNPPSQAARTFRTVPALAVLSGLDGGVG